MGIDILPLSLAFVPAQHEMHVPLDQMSVDAVYRKYGRNIGITRLHLFLTLADLACGEVDLDLGLIKVGLDCS